MMRMTTMMAMGWKDNDAKPQSSSFDADVSGKNECVHRPWITTSNLSFPSSGYYYRKR